MCHSSFPRECHPGRSAIPPPSDANGQPQVEMQHYCHFFGFLILKSCLRDCPSAGGHLLSDVGLAISPQDGAAMIKASLRDGRAMAKFRAMIESQGVDSSTAHALCQPAADVFHVLPAADYQTDVFAPITGLIITSLLCLCSFFRTHVRAVFCL